VAPHLHQSKITKAKEISTDDSLFFITGEVSAMNNMLGVDKPYQVEGDYGALIKNGVGLLKGALHQLGTLMGGIGGLIIVGMLVLAGLFTVIAVFTFVKNCFWYVF
jgi:hypothetical protein